MRDPAKQAAAKRRYYERSKAAVIARTAARRQRLGRVTSEVERRASLERAHAWYRAHPTAHRRRDGLPEPTRPCPQLCECCGRLPGKRAMHLDHCHITDEFRGWLCGRCNKGIGALGDTISGLKSALKYLERAYRIGAHH